MSAAELDLHIETESERIERWRAEELERAGYDPGDAVELAGRSDVDLHLAIELLERGCPPRRAPHPPLATRPSGTGRMPRPCCHLASIPSPSQRRHRHRPAAHPHVRADAAARDRGVHRADRRALDAARRRLGSRPARRRLGRRVRDRRRPRLPRHHELERGARPVVGAVRGLAGRARRLGRDPARLPRRRLRRPPLGRERAAVRRRGRARACCSRRASAGWGNWFNQELFGKPTDLPWGLEIDARPPAAAVRRSRTRSTRRSSTSSSTTSRWPAC